MPKKDKIRISFIHPDAHCQVLARRLSRETVSELRVFPTLQVRGCSHLMGYVQHLHLDVLPEVDGIHEGLGSDYEPRVVRLCLDTGTAKLLGEALLDWSSRVDAENVIKEITGA